ncbi:Nucleoside-diphosphate-sugar epimerase [Natrinema hispanicum]|uniref:Nucleoside-diphosphate-sugar epimerase n=1 Tax=Natrinema hispanicum TaxID=392421 RepID=A0A1G6WUF9_9EURY|nr:SDR family oxidoreductase [Natrinema hispanicum]SDD69532.1 Nucleoside-diphosphate-sugar epimerase [Natrinema hispanicum]
MPTDGDDTGIHVLVTGGCGYIGSALIPLLQADKRVGQVTVLDSLAAGSPANLMAAQFDGNLEFIRGNIRNYGDVETAMRSVDRVIHLAAITGAESTHDRVEETRAVNLEGSRNVFNAARKVDVDHVVFASSCNNYGRAASTNLDEATEPDPLNPYAETKYEAETLLKEYVNEGAFTGTALRMSTNYGYSPGIRFNLVVNHFVFRALTNRPLTVYGDGSNWRPFIHVRDAARAYYQAACEPDAWSEHVYNVGSNDQNYRIETIAEIVRDELDTGLELTYLEDQNPGPSYHVNFDRLATTGFEPQWTLCDGVRDLATRFTAESQFGEAMDTADKQPLTSRANNDD